jgi:hypothetical protein
LIEEPFQLFGPFAYARRDRIRGIHVPKGDLKRSLHRLFPFPVPHNNSQPPMTEN